MIYWKGGTLEVEVLATQAVNKWIDSDEDPCEVFYDTLEDLMYEPIFSDYLDAFKIHLNTSTKRMRAARKNGKGKGFG